MQFKFFVVPCGNLEDASAEMNKFLRSHRILEESHELVAGKNGSSWHFCIKYLEQNRSIAQVIQRKVDYKHVLDEKTFAKFSKLREIRKRIAEDEAIPAYAIFTDKELSEIAKLDEITEKKMQSITGIGKKKIEKYGKLFIAQP